MTEKGNEPEGQPARWQRPITIEIGIGTIVLVVAVVIAAYLLFRIPHFWLIVLTAVVLATAMDKPVAYLSQKGLPRSLAILAIYLCLILFIGGAIAALAPIIAGDAQALEAELPRYTSGLEQLAASLPTSVQGGNHISLAEVETAAQGHVSALARGITDISIEFGRSLFYVFVTLVVAFFLAAEPGIILARMRNLTPARHRDRVVRVGSSIHERIGAWARGQLLIAIIFGLLMGSGLRLIGVPYAWSLGAVAGILEIVPYVGGVITVILAVVSAATVGIPQVIGVIVLYVILVNLESHVLAPLLYGRALGLPPVAILLALLAGVELLGILGALLAVPLTVIFWAIAEEFMPKRVEESGSRAVETARRPDGEVGRRRYRDLTP